MTTLAGVRIETADLTRTVEVYRCLSGIASEPVEANSGEVDVPLAGARLTIVPTTQMSGVTGISLLVPDLPASIGALHDIGVDVASESGGIRIEAALANGIEVSLLSAESEGPPGNASARLDHVALRVRDLETASSIWSAITGTPGQQMGIHPISGGAFIAARFLLGGRMIELIAPVAGVESQIASRLASHGEGVAALALPVDDVAAARARLERIGARVFRQDPHWMVHPKDAAGVLVQLTPRVAH